VPDLHVIEAEPAADDIAEKLREALADAEAGRLSCIAIAVVYRDGSTGNSWSKMPSIGTLVGSIALLQARLQRLILDED
jgi:hypothetical protein